MDQRYPFWLVVLWGALGKRIPAISFVSITLAPLLINLLFAALEWPPVIANPWMWSVIGGLSAVVVFFFLRIYQLEKNTVPKIEFAPDINETTEPVNDRGQLARLLRIE